MCVCGGDAPFNGGRLSLGVWLLGSCFAANPKHDDQNKKQWVLHMASRFDSVSNCVGSRWIYGALTREAFETEVALAGVRWWLALFVFESKKGRVS